MNKRLVEIKFGSHLYGTSTPASDLDLKAVHIPDGQDILLQRVKGSISWNTKLDGALKNTAEDIDRESYSVQKYLNLVTEGQTVALDMLFAPDWAWQSHPGWEWQTILDNRDKLLTKGCAAFLGYCRQQSAKYGIKGSRVAAARTALTFLKTELTKRGAVAKLGELDGLIHSLMANTEYMAIVPITNAAGVTTHHWEVCGRKMPYTASIKTAWEVMNRLVGDYGQRALQAERNEGIDWKALSHAVRVGHEAIEFLNTGNITVPRPEDALLLAIKKGEMVYQPVAEMIEDLLEQVEMAARQSQLPVAPDRRWIDDFVMMCHQEAARAIQIQGPI